MDGGVVWKYKISWLVSAVCITLNQGKAKAKKNVGFPFPDPT
jgi:hypothetical protein